MKSGTGALLCFVHPDTSLGFPPGYWDDVERVNDTRCPRDYCQWMTRETHERTLLVQLGTPGQMVKPP